ncbi:selenium-dependent molybdenum cofactor biosynthesis protein YqeB [Morganella morganii]|uniref:selenium-dependent molybdenum cofactor biosynthesis protein YqeB n=1 Tax=Morganella morganii TaxID=582 RepID=UPI001BDA33EF|nr:selenium-dependent molybdenum cofactor biosynthesis protein YqeB [Morganella morganii]MBT0520157.1 EF2563 family selenium-dependent molybdenum hydroxylase system protein [Morganella morganii subsp. morganii]QWL89040.1 EF2563 family selenium-dependent molybdenum hydroxylase system protein [Morganella morganii subsp. morganii]
MKIFTEAAKLVEKNCPFAMAEIIECSGSTPRHSAQMLVLGDGKTIGTIGGGMVERKVIEEAVDALHEGRSRMFHGRMARNGQHAVGSDCGGAMSVFIAVHGVRPRLILLGGGHVNRAIAQLAAFLNIDIHVADVYAGSLEPDLFPPSTRLWHAPSFTDAVNQLDPQPEDYVIIATNSQDLESLNCLIGKPLKYLGLLGSRRKVQTFTKQLSESGVSDAQLSRLHAPVGYDIGAETPHEIAVSILAELLQVMNDAPGGAMKQNQAEARRAKRVVIRGAGDLATGVALRLYHSGFEVVMLDVCKPTVIRCTVSFAQALYDGESCVEGVCARYAHDIDEVNRYLKEGTIPVLADEHGELLPALHPDVVVDAIIAKRNVAGTHRKMAPCTIALGPGFEAGVDCDAVIETQRGHHLGRVITHGSAAPNTGIPGNINGKTTERVLRAPHGGMMTRHVNIGDLVHEGDVIARIGDTEILSPMDGMVRGLLNEGLCVPEGFKIADVDPRGALADFRSVSDKARAIGGGVLEAIMTRLNKMDSAPKC